MNSLGYIRLDDHTVAYFGYDPSDYSNVYELREDTGSGSPSYSEGQILVFLCNGFTKVVFKFRGGAPYSTTEYEENSPSCGFVPDVCDISMATPVVADETFTGLNDGTLKAFAVSSYNPITYYLTGQASNLTGYFIGLSPGTYTLTIIDAHGCQLSGDYIINPGDVSGTRYKYRLAFKSVKNQTEYELRFLDQKHLWPVLQYPKDMKGTDSPIVKKTTNSNEDKTESILPSSLAINVYVDGTFTVLEFANAAERDWKIELYKRVSILGGSSTFDLTLTESISPFIDANLQLKFNGIVVQDMFASGMTSTSGFSNQPYSIEALGYASIEINPKMTFTIYKNGDLVFNQTVSLISQISIVYVGTIGVDDNYDVSVVTASGGTDVSPVNIPDNTGFELDFQGWLLPDEIQDLYADPQYPIQLIATDGLLSLKGSPFGDLAESYIDSKGIKRLIQLFGLRKIAFLFKICLQQLGYNFGETIIISSLCYKSYDSSQWLFYSTWVDLFYDADGIAKDTYAVLEIILKGLHLQIFQHEGKYIIRDINDLFYRNNTILASKFLQSAIGLDNTFSFINYTPSLPVNGTIGYGRIIRPINPKQTLNYDKAFNQCEANIDFNLLALLFPNPGFELNSVQGDVPYGMTQTVNMNAFANYNPPTLLVGSGAYLGEWEMRTIGKTLLLRDGFGNPIVQAGTDILFCSDGYRSVILEAIIDQYNKKLNLSFVWRPIKYSDFENVCPRLTIYFTVAATGNAYIYSLTAKGGFVTADGPSGWYLPDHGYSFVFLAQSISDYTAWNNFSITTDRFPEDGIGTIQIFIGTPLRNNYDVMTDDNTIDYDQLILTQSDAADIYNFQTGEKHNITNVTSYAKAEKKSIDLSLFTFERNKRISGNVSYGDDYLTSQITNEWFYRLSVEQLPDRLPAQIIKRIAKNYQRPMYKWQGDISTDSINYYMVFAIDGLPNRIFIAFTIEMDLRNSTGNIVLIEIDDTQTQSGYNYLPIYEKSARNNRS